MANRGTRTALALIEPGANAVLSSDEPSSIFWYGGDHTDTVSLDLFKGGQFQSSIATNISAHLRFFDWSIPTSVPTGNDYQIRITLNGSTSADSANFSIIEPVGPLVAHWSLDDETGSNVTDETGNGFDGTLSNASRVTGLIGDALDFNGSNSTVALPAAAFQSIGDEITISMWVFGAENQPRRDSVFYAVNSSNGRVLNVHLPWETGQIFWDAGITGNRNDRISSPDPTNNPDVTDDQTQYKGRWNHWTFTKSATSGEMRIYVNGSLFLSGNGNTRSMAGITAASLGSQTNTAGTAGLSYSGLIDDVRLYNVSLDATEIESLFNSYAATNGVPFAWLIENGFAPSEATAQADPDGDGQDNGLEYFLGRNPNQRETLYQDVSTDGDTFSLIYTRRKLDDVTIVAEWSPDLSASSWDTQGITEMIMADDGVVETVLVTTDRDEDKKFLRIRIGD